MSNSKALITIVALILFASLKIHATEQQLTFKQIQINEEIEPGTAVLNLTDFVKTQWNRSVESIKFEMVSRRSGQFQLSEYFQIETKRARNYQNETSTTNIVLRTSGRKLDREYLCRLSSLRNECSCESECLVWLELVVDNKPARLPIVVMDINDNKPFFYSANLKIDLDLSSSTEASVRIPLKEAIDLDSMARNRVRQYIVVEETQENRPNSLYREGKVSVQVEENGEKNNEKPKVSLVVEWMPQNMENFIGGESLLSKQIKLSALDPNYTTTQSISIQLKLPIYSNKSSNVLNEINHPLNPNSSHKISWLNHIYFVSAINEIDILFSNKTNTHEVLLKSRTRKNYSSNELEQTLAYLIVEKSKFMSAKDSISIESEQLIDDVAVGPNSSLLRVDEMRNGLYSISSKSFLYDIIKEVSNSTNTSVYSLRIIIRFNNLKLVKKLNMQVPRNILEILKEINNNEFKSTSTIFSVTSRKHEQTSRRRLLAPFQVDPSTSTTINLNLYNSVIVVSIASAILVVFGLACFSISLLLYFTNKFSRKKKNIFNKQEGNVSNKENKIVVYDVPSGQENKNSKQTVYSLASSLSSDCGDTSTTSTNNISPMTTTTTSNPGTALGFSSSTGPLFQTHLETAVSNVLNASSLNVQPSVLKQNLAQQQKNHVFEWFIEQQKQQQEITRFNFSKNSKNDMNQHPGLPSTPSSSPLSVSSTANLIKTMETESSISSSTASSSFSQSKKTPLNTVLDEENCESYKNDLFRSSHQIIYKQQLAQHQNCGVFANPKSKITKAPSPKMSEETKPNLGLLYEAKPLNIKTWETEDEVKSDKMAMERDQIIDRLSAAIANLNTSIKSENINEHENDKEKNDQFINEIRQISSV